MWGAGGKRQNVQFGEQHFFTDAGSGAVCVNCGDTVSILKGFQNTKHTVTDLIKAFLGNGSVNTVNVQQWKSASVEECYCALLGNSATMKTLAGNHVTCSLCGLPYATIELCFLCVVRAEAI
jgi:hypothetical protein